MTYKEAREYLIPIAANCVLPQYAAALEKAMEALQEVESLRAQLEQAVADLRECGRKDTCDFCKYNGLPAHCEGADFFCDDCSHTECRCHDCRESSKFEWRGVPEVENG